MSVFRELHSIRKTTMRTLYKTKIPVTILYLAMLFGPTLGNTQENFTIQDLQEAARNCLIMVQPSGRRVIVGNDCPADLSNVSDCIVLTVPGRSQRRSEFGRAVGETETVRLGTDCQPEQSAGRPGGSVPASRAASIQDQTTPWHGSGVLRQFEAKVSIGDQYSIERVSLRQTRHYWPGRNEAHLFVADEIDDQTFRVVPPLVATWIRADHVFYEWQLEYSDNETGEKKTIRSTGSHPHDFVLDCTAQQTAATLAQIVNVASGFSNNPQENPGYPVPSHILPGVSLADQGMPYATPGAVSELTTVSIGSPSLLQFEPGTIQRFEDARLAALAYGTLYSSPTRRPSLGCIPSSEWFVHEAGWHRYEDGGMTLYSVTEPRKGVATVSIAPPLNQFEPGIWHTRLWDLHVWLPETTLDAPVLAIESPTPIAGIPTSPGVFFYPETFE